MIYIFDDKKNRQEGYRWSNEKFKQYADFLTPVYHYSEVREDDDRKKIFSEGNTILFHESFFDTDFNRHQKEAIKIRRELEELAQTHPNFSLAFFSGSKSSRLLNNNIAYLPVSIMYQNLEEFIKQSKNGIIDLKYLLYGKNPNIEQELVEKLKDSNAGLLKLDEPFVMSKKANILIARTSTNDRLPQIVTGVNYKMNLSSDSHVDIHEVIIEHLQATQYDKIFVPLCFGTSMSDFNGLRLVAHIRCTDTINRCTPVYIYGFVGLDTLINHEYFNILKTKNVQIINYSIKAFEDIINSTPEPLELSELPQEMAKLKLDVPKDYEDSHSIANEWAIYRWAKAINTNDNAIQKIIDKVNTQLYFKYLSTIYPTTEILAISEEELKLKNTGKPKILYVDDDAEKGWYEILCKILSDINDIDVVDYLGDDLKLVSQDEIINRTTCKVQENDIDIVILDFRLHPDDFVVTNIKNVTGFKLLQNIKKINPGIQVIIFSATTKIWNLQALQEAGADGFIIKESPENSFDPSFTTQTIESFKSTIAKCLRNYFLKIIFSLIDPVTKLVKIESEKKPSKFSLSIHQNTIQNINQRIEIFNQLIYNFPSNLEWAFSTLILIIEEIVNALYIDDGLDHVVEINIFKKVKCNYTSSLGRCLSIKPNHNSSNYTNEEYVVPENDITFYNKTANRDPFNFRLTCILYYKYEIPLGAQISKYYPLYKLRSTSVMHVGTDKVRLSDLILGITLLKEIIK